MAKNNIIQYPNKPLTNGRRENFCQMVADGIRPSEAYKKTYKCSSVVAQASTPRMLGYAEVKNRIAFLQEKNAENKAERRRRKLAACENIWSGNEPEAQISDRLRAIDIDNKMCGDYQPLKLDLGDVGDVLAGLVISTAELEEAASARRECFAKIRNRQEDYNA